MDAADDLLHNKFTPRRLTPRKTTYIPFSSRSRGQDQKLCDRSTEMKLSAKMLPPSRPPPPPPSPTPRQSVQQAHNENMREFGQEIHDGDSQDPASKIWEKIRNYSAGLSNHNVRKSSTSTINSVTASISLPFSANGVTDSRDVRRKKAINDYSNNLTMQRQRLVGMSSKASLTDRTNMSKLGDTTFCSPRRTSKPQTKSRRGSGRWSIGNWWG